MEVYQQLIVIFSKMNLDTFLSFGFGLVLLLGNFYFNRDVFKAGASGDYGPKHIRFQKPRIQSDEQI